jgi:transcriptional regulator with XRE-family HTH domain
VEEFHARFGAALRRRLYPNAALHLKEIAGAIGRSENTVTRWWRGETRVSGADLYRIAQFFGRRGDFGFLNDIFADLQPDAVRVATQHPDRRASDRAGGDVHTWFRDDGVVALASAGHADYVASTLEMPREGGDLVSYSVRMLGWIAVTERADGVVIIRHDGRRVAALAAERVCAWLEDRVERIRYVRRIVHMEGSWIEARHPVVRAAVFAVGKAAFIGRVARRQWQISRLSLGAVSDPRLVALLHVYNTSPDKLVHAAAEMGAFTTSSLFGVNGDEVVSHHAPTAYGFDTAVVEGLNVLSRPDTDYALMVRERILRTKREGPTYHELVGTIDDTNVRYLNLALPESGITGRVLTSTVMLEMERPAA